jgi:hypothetical protein
MESSKESEKLVQRLTAQGAYFSDWVSGFKTSSPSSLRFLKAGRLHRQKPVLDPFGSYLLVVELDQR